MQLMAWLLLQIIARLLRSTTAASQDNKVSSARNSLSVPHSPPGVEADDESANTVTTEET